MFDVTCQSGRYDLSLFVDCEVGLIGASRRPATDSLRVLEVEKVEVLVTFTVALSEKLPLEESLKLIAKQGYQRLLVGDKVGMVIDPYGGKERISKRL